MLLSISRRQFGVIVVVTSSTRPKFVQVDDGAQHNISEGVGHNKIGHLSDLTKPR